MYPPSGALSSPEVFCFNFLFGSNFKFSEELEK